MFPEFRVDLSNFSSTKAMLLATPIAPGLAVVFGVAVIKPDLMKAYFTLGYLGYFAKVSVLALLGYMVGACLLMTIGALVFLALVLPPALYARVVRWRIWKLFRGKDSPGLVQNHSASSDSPDLVRQKITRAYLEKAHILAPVAGSPEDVRGQWQSWWKVLVRAFRDDDDDESLLLGFGIAAMLHTTATICVILFYYLPFHHWVLWLFAIAFFLCTSIIHFAIMSLAMEDDDNEKLSARILRRLVDLNKQAAEAAAKTQKVGGSEA